MGVDDPSVSLVAWTTTPWTLPSNLALCVNPDFTYVKVEDNTKKHKGKVFILAKCRLAFLYPGKKGDANSNDFKVLQEMKGTDLVGTKYTPIFDYFKTEQEKRAYRVISDNFVTEDGGTGVVHCAPAFGGDDYRVCLENEICPVDDLLCPVDEDGCFDARVTDFAKRKVKEADNDIIDLLVSRGRLVKKELYNHSYPFCWRSDPPLIYKAVTSWFVNVTKIKEQLLKSNSETYWVPQFVRDKRFHNWLQNARDWNISRNRFWGTPIPMWINPDDDDDRICVGSVEELEKLSGQPPGSIKDLHMHNIDHLTIPSSKHPGQKLHRISEVFDCWFESGSMPYGQLHYPFENQEYFKQGFPADFIAEGLDQTRGWFYSLMVLSTALYERPAFKNLIVNGLVLAEDGKKMSKRLKNYPDPMYVVNQYGADALRLYLMNSPCVKAEELKFKEQGVLDVIKDVFLPWYNAYRFFVQNALRFEADTNTAFVADLSAAKQSANKFDRWIISCSESLTAYVREELAAYHLNTVMPRLLQFIDELTNWYVRLNRDRFRGSGGATSDDISDQRAALSTLHTVLVTLCKLMGPFTPYLTESMYQNLRNCIPAGASSPGDPQNTESVHYCMLPDADTSAINTSIEQALKDMQNVVVCGRTIRDRNNCPIKLPLDEPVVIHRNPTTISNLESLQGYLVDEVNVRKVTLTDKEGDFVAVSAAPNFKKLGKALGQDLPIIQAQLAHNVSEQDIRAFENGSPLTVEAAYVTGPDASVWLPTAEDKYVNVKAGKKAKKGEPEVAPFAGPSGPVSGLAAQNCTVSKTASRTFNDDDLTINRSFKVGGGGQGNYESFAKDNFLVLLDVTRTKDNLEEYQAREVVTRVNKLKKAADLQQGDEVEVFYSVTKIAVSTSAPAKPAAASGKKAKGNKETAEAPVKAELGTAIQNKLGMIEAKIRAPLMPLSSRPAQLHCIMPLTETIDEEFSLTLELCRRSVVLSPSLLKSLSPSMASSLGSFLVAVGNEKLVSQLTAGPVPFEVNSGSKASGTSSSQTVTLELGKNCFNGVQAMLAAKSNASASASASAPSSQAQKGEAASPSDDSFEAKLAKVLSVDEECIEPSEMEALLRNKAQPICYDGFEPSGRVHIAQGVFKAINVNKLTSSGCKFIFWVADWFAMLNNKFDGDLDKIRTVGQYMVEVWKAVGMDMTNVEFIWASDEINSRASEYWELVMNIARLNNLPRIQRCCTIMGRKDTDELSAAQIFYPCMQCPDIFFLKADIAQLGMDQRKVNMLAREYCTKIKKKDKPIILSHHMLAGLKEGQEKMSKSDPDSAIFMEDTEMDVNRKIKSAYCPPGVVEKNPCLEYVRYVILPFRGKLELRRKEENGGDKEYTEWQPVEDDYRSGAIHPGDMKDALKRHLNAILQPVRDHFNNNAEAKKLVEKVRKLVNDQYKKGAGGK